MRRCHSPCRRSASWLREAPDRQLCADVIAHLAFREQQHDGLAIAIRDGMEFGVQAAFRAPDTAGNIPFLSRLAAVAMTAIVRRMTE